MIYLVMGVSCAGKTTIGSILAPSLGALFLDADTFHSSKNIKKMKQGIPLDDLDRNPWLLKINSELVKISSSRKSVVIACSALKATHRAKLLQGIANYLIIYLKAESSLLRRRQSARKNHFFNSSLLSSQLAILEVPTESYIEIDVSASAQVISMEILRKIQTLK